MLPAHLLSAMTGMASSQIRKVLNDAIEPVISADTRVKIAFISTDGDEGHRQILLYVFRRSSYVLRSAGLRRES
jgi:hypothetical protein